MPRRLLLASAIIAAFVAPSVVVAASPSSATLERSTATMARGARDLTVKVSSSGVGTCRIVANVRGPGLPKRLDPCPSSADVSLRLPINHGLQARRVHLSLVAEGATLARTTVLQRSPYRVLLYGDSIAWQFAPVFKRQLVRTGAVLVHTAVFPGTSLCDGLALAASDAAAFRPDVVVAQYVGSPFTACSQAPSYGTFGQPGWYAQLTRDATSMARTFKAAGASALLLDAGPVHQDSSVARDATLAAYARASRATGGFAKRIKPYLAVEDPGDRYTTYLPCLAKELANGRCIGPLRHQVASIRVRSPAPDSFHLCPVTFGDRLQAGCATYSSGVARYAGAITAPIIEGWGLTPVPAYLP